MADLSWRIHLPSHPILRHSVPLCYLCGAFLLLRALCVLSLCPCVRTPSATLSRPGCYTNCKQLPATNRKALRQDRGHHPTGIEDTVRYLKYAVLLGVFVFFLAASNASAQVRVGVGVGIGPAPVCAYGYYGYYPYACAPAGYYAPNWFVNGVFIGAGPW